MKMTDVLLEAGQAPIYYFAYGMLTDPKLMPGAKLIGPAELKNFCFEMFTYANVIPQAGNRVIGSLWVIDRELLSQLDQTEGYPYLYDRKAVPVFVKGQRYEAFVYTMTPETRTHMKGTMPGESYIARIERGYQNAGIPLSQLDDALIAQKYNDLDEGITDSHREKIRQTMVSAGYDLLGHGADASVWAKDANTVIKILMPDSGELSTGEKTFIDFYNYVIASKSNPFLPRFIKIQGRHYKRFTIDGEPFVQIAMERLQPIIEGSALQGIVWVLSECASKQLTWQEVYNDFLTESDIWRYWSGDPDVPELVYDMMIGQTANQSFYEALYLTMLILARTGAHHGWGWDLHTENVMQRGDGTPVIIDPWYHDVLGTV